MDDCIGEETEIGARENVSGKPQEGRAGRNVNS
jgi:hypothetical protein